MTYQEGIIKAAKEIGFENTPITPYTYDQLKTNLVRL